MKAANYLLAAKPQRLCPLPRLVSRQSGSARSRRVSIGVFWQIALVDLLSGGLLALGHVRPAAVCMWALLGIALLRLVLLRRHGEVACLLVGTAPMINLLRGAVLYTGVPLLYLAGLGYVAWSQPAMTRKLFRQPTLPAALLALSVLYYILSVLNTFNVRENIRVFELTCAAILMCYLTSVKDLLPTAIVGFLVSGLIVGASAFPHLNSMAMGRLGGIATEDLAIGNPFGLGVPLALGLLALCQDRGHWLGLANRAAIRLGLLVPTVVLLALSASRTGWLISAAGLVVGAGIGRKQRLPLVFAILSVAIVGIVLTTTPLAEPFQRGWNRTFGEGRDIEKASSGRSTHWSIFWHAFTDSPKALAIGYGPGKGPLVFAEYSRRIPGIERGVGAQVAFHGLIMHIGVELGLLGLVALGLWLLLALRKAMSAFGRTGLVLPLVALMGFILATLTAKGFDTVVGTFLGLGLVASGPDWGIRQRLPRSKRSTAWRIHQGAVLPWQKVRKTDGEISS